MKLNYCYRALEARERTLGPDHAYTLSSVNDLASLLNKRGQLDEAEPLYRRALDGYERTLGPDHEDTLRIAGNLESLLQARIAGIAKPASCCIT